METSFYENRLKGTTKPQAVTVYENQDFSYRAHWHQEIEVVYVKEGSLKIGVNEEVRKMMPGDICLLRSGDIHYYESCPAGSVAVTILFRIDLVKDFYFWMEKNISASTFMTKAEVREYGVEGIYKLSDQMCEEVKEEKSAGKEMIKAYATLLLIEIMRKWPCGMEEGKKPKQLPKQKQIQEILVYIEQHVEDSLTIVDLAERFYMDRFYLSKVFNNVTGMHFKQYINRLRVALAEEKLTLGNDSIVDIAYDCGYGSVRNFNRVFKNIKGKTPREIRAEFS